jgi:hypothetical protein
MAFEECKVLTPICLAGLRTTENMNQDSKSLG